ncbi:hypothetical protein GSI_00766 [Ganoderma sinense ZZ0214-1]|uniref:Uncharacterized protein n=1 Tax=Ganoderma sinense ZZ0214-1 TaxID=1077348 RepID=A0A2G8STI9_9APHY|nr:hypothetical protein GSI_00766 [Ganoderma sinense ZZ0214-1]
MQLGYTRNVEPTSARVIAQCANNDKIVISALKQGKAKGLNGLGAIEKLGNANGHPNSLWKNYTLARLDKISPKVYSSCTAPRSTNRGGSRKRPSPGGPIPPQRPQRAASSSNCTGIYNSADLNCFMDKSVRRDNQVYQPFCPMSEQDRLPANIQIRSRRGGPIPEYHAGTLIAPLAPSSRPKPPVRDPDHDYESHRFTDEDKIFFIHFLKWYLGQGRGARIPERDDLYRLLARQTPHHNAEAWRRHWDDAPELPDKIYIEARKRADDAALARSASLSPSSDEDGSEDGSDVEDDGLFEESTSPVLNQVQRISPTQRHPQKAARRFRVVEEDLRDMARYKYERRDVWDQLPNIKARWKEFAKRPQNCQRSLQGWYAISRGHHEEINRYYKEYADAACDERSELDVESELEYVDVATSDQCDTGSRSGSSSTSSGPSTQASDEASTLPGSKTVPLKRERTESETATACSLGNAEEDFQFPAAKRMKEEEEDEKPELSVVDSD